MNKKANGYVIGFFFIFIVTCLALMNGIDSVNEHAKGVKVRMGQITGTMESGIAWTGLFTTVHEYDLLTRRIDLSFEGDNFAPAKDKQAVYGNIAVNYRINADDKTMIDLRSRYGNDAEVAQKMQLDLIIVEGFKQAIAEYSADEIQENRQLVKEKTIEKIKANFPNTYFTLEQVTVSNLHFNKAYQNAIEAAKVAEKDALTAQKFEAIKVAEANANVAEAEGKKQVRIKAAEAAAQETKLAAEAEATALKLKKAQLTPLMVELERITKWDGAYPKFMMGESSNMLFQMPMDSANVATN